MSKQTLNGQVINNCTDSGAANIKINFKTLSKKTAKPTLETITDNNGYFTFPDVDIINSKDYTYALYIPTISGIAANKPELTRFDGTTMHFYHDQAGTFFKPRVTPGFYQLRFVCTTTLTSTFDTLKLFLSQPIFHKNVPDVPYEFSSGAISTQSLMVSGGGDGYPMGKYIIKIIKCIAGNYSTSYDSIYLKSADTKTYSIHW
ncbi:MAG TPA: hypothetical protein DCF44_08470 [Chitinophagaceae bacterium]|nr:hypothetical protein [Chitinophagaceae bacterium]